MYKSMIVACAALAVAQAWQECGKHQIQVKGKCQCKLGYIKFHDVCSRCPEDSRFSCKINTCVCQKGKVYDVKSNTCKIVHQEKSTDTYSKHTQKYTPDYSSTTKTSYHGHSYCGQNQIYSQGGCVCSTGFTKYDGYHCIKNCPYNGHWQVAQNSCVCNFGLKWDGQGKECIPDCRNNEVFTPGGGCTCKPGFNKYDGVNCIKCPSRSYWQAGQCVCEWGLVLKGDECVQKH